MQLRADPSASISQELQLQACAKLPGVYVVLGMEPRASHILSKHFISRATFPDPEDNNLSTAHQHLQMKQNSQTSLLSRLILPNAPYYRDWDNKGTLTQPCMKLKPQCLGGGVWPSFPSKYLGAHKGMMHLATILQKTTKCPSLPGGPPTTALGLGMTQPLRSNSSWPWSSRPSWNYSIQ